MSKQKGKYKPLKNLEIMVDDGGEWDGLCYPSDDVKTAVLDYYTYRLCVNMDKDLHNREILKERYGDNLFELKDEEVYFRIFGDFR